MSTRDGVWCVVVAGGAGRRFGSPKQFEDLAGMRVIDRAVATAAGCCEGVVVVLPERFIGSPDGVVPGADTVVAGGASRSESARLGIEAVPDGAEVILVHDGARPLAPPALFGRVVEAVRGGAEAVVPVVPVRDTIRSTDSQVVDRESLRAVQTPQGFAAATLRAAVATGAEATDDAALVAAGGTPVTMVEGDPSNLKVTEPVDLEFARALHTTEERRVEHETRLRVGNGFDIHRFSEDPGRPLVLGGVTFEGRAGLIGHSDADVVAHAVAEALLGAAGLGDLGSHFPDDDDRFANADSIELLRAVSGEVTAGGWEVANVDCSVIAEHPKLAPAREQMQSRLSAAVGAPVTVKGRRAEGMGDLGRGDGIAATATALLVSAAGRR